MNACRHTTNLFFSALFLVGLSTLNAQLNDGLIAYWPLDEVQGTKTPELVNGYDMQLTNLSADDVVEGKIGNAFSFSNEKQTLLSRVHDAADQLPANKYDSFSISMWSKVDGNGQNDLRLFSEANTGNSNPLFNIGTANNGASGSIDFYIRQSGWPTVNHTHSTAEPYDGEWHHVVFVQEDGERRVYVDGELDDVELVAKPEGTFNVNDTTIGGILRSSASHWVTGLIDDVAVWKRALDADEAAQVYKEGLASVFPTLGNGLIAYWPLDEVQGTKTPELINGYDMELTNMSAENVVEGRIGNAFSFSNEKQTLLSRVHDAADQLPANKHDSFSISMWSKVDGNGQNDLRLFSEANTGNSNPLFNIGTANNGASGSIDFYIRQSGWPTVNHTHSTAEPYDGEWHHVVFVQEDGERRVYVDGELDDVELVAKPEGAFNVNDTTIGGILRSSASHWVTGLIDDVAVWKRALNDGEAAQVYKEGLASLFPSLANGLIAHWPLDEVQGTKTPELINGYDMELTNMSGENVVEGRIGNAFSFSNEKQTLLSRVHDAADLLPANKHESHTVSMWSKVDGNGQNDLRLFSEANTGDSNPLFNIGTANNGASGSIDFYIRQSGWPTVNHIHSTAEPYDGEWHHVVFVQEDGERRVYVDGELDDVELVAKPEGTFRVNDTTIGGILRSSASHWVTGLIDDVAIWNRALNDDEVGFLFTDGIPTGMKKKLPLEIRRFDADFPAVAAGGKVTLHWDASADAALILEPKALLDPNYSDDGIVNPVSKFGVGSIEVTVKEATTFMLKAVRGNEVQEATLTVDVISGVGDGWTLVDNFEFRDSAKAEEPLLDVNDTSIGGILRASASHWVTGLIDDVAIWKRALTDEEISAMQDSGLENRTESLSAEMIAYWPMDEIKGDVTPDVINGYDLELTNLTADDLVEGQSGQAFSFSNENKTLLSRVHDAADELPANKHNSFTISMWSKVDGNGQNDLRLFSEANTANNTPLFNIGTANDGESGSVDLYIRQGGWPTVGHIYSTAEPYDGEWRHVVFVQENGQRRLYVDGEIDDLEIPSKPSATFDFSKSINGQGGWQNPVGAAVVFDAEGNQSLGFTGADDLNALQLRSLQIAEGEKATVFFRLATLDDDAVDGQVNVLFGITEKPIRFVGDFNNDAGPIVRLTKEPGFGPITLNARDGVGNEYTIGDAVLDFGGVYNIWIDVENKSSEDGDIFSVYISEEGQAERVVVFENFVSDRNPAGTVDLGKPKADLLSLLIMSSGLNAGVGNLLFDDLYISVGKYLDTVPVASSFVGAAAPEIVLHSSRVLSDGAGFSFDWESSVGNIYEVQRQAALGAVWKTIADAYPEGGATGKSTSYTDADLGVSAFYRVAQLAAPPLFFEDFESGAKGWDASDLGESGTLWELGKPTNGPGTAHSPVNVYGTGLTKDYEDYTDVYLVSPVIDLTGIDNARLEFRSYRDCESLLDGDFTDWCQVMILDEDGEWLIDDPIWIRGGTAKQWRLEKAKIPAEALGQKIRLEFNFSSDGGQDDGPQAGWFIDDVAITTK